MKKELNEDIELALIVCLLLERLQNLLKKAERASKREKYPEYLKERHLKEMSNLIFGLRVAINMGITSVEEFAEPLSRLDLYYKNWGFRISNAIEYRDFHRIKKLCVQVKEVEHAWRQIPMTKEVA